MSLARYRRALAAALALALALAGFPGCASGTSAGSVTAGSSHAIAAAGSAAIEASDRDASQPDEGSGSAETPADTPALATGASTQPSQPFDIAQLPGYTGSPYIEIAGNVPTFSDADLNGPQESYSPLDGIGRCGTTQAIVSPATMPTEERGSIGMIRPSGWHTVRYDDLIGDRYLFNRCHLIGYQLTGENANERNLITGTRYLNVEGMLPFEDEVADYVHRTGNRVLYRSTPVFVGDELVARGVHLEARSVEDDGAGVCFNVFCYNVQPGIGIDYTTGESWRLEEAPAADATSTAADAATATTPQAAPESPTVQQAAPATDYVLNTNTRKFHLPGCRSVTQMSAHNKQEVTATRDELIAQGYEPCGNCNP